MVPAVPATNATTSRRLCGLLVAAPPGSAYATDVAWVPVATVGTVRWTLRPVTTAPAKTTTARVTSETMPASAVSRTRRTHVFVEVRVWGLMVVPFVAEGGG